MAIKKPSTKHKDAKRSKSKPKHELEIKEARFSKKNLIIFAVVFATIGGFAIWRAFAAQIYVDLKVCQPAGQNCVYANISRTIPVNSTQSISWAAEGAPFPITCTDNYGSEPNSGSRNLTMSANFTWSMTCKNPPSDGDVVTRQISFTTYSPPTASLSASPSTIQAGSSSNLYWSSANTSGCSTSWLGAQGPSGGPSPVSPGGTTTYSISCSGLGGTASASATVTVTQPQGAASVSLNPKNPSISKGQSVTLSWSNNANTTSCPSSSPSGWPGTTSKNSSKAVSPASTTTYSITCVNSAGSPITDSTTVTVQGTTPLKPTVSIAAKPASIAYNGTTFIQWSTTNATSCSAGWTGLHSTTGTQKVGPLTKATTYSITCSGLGGSASASTKVTVAAAPKNCPPNCPTPAAPPAPTEQLAPPEVAPEPVVTEEPTTPQQPACHNPNHLVNILLGGLVGELISLVKHSCGH